MQVSSKSFVEEILDIFGFGAVENKGKDDALPFQPSNGFIPENNSETGAVERNLVDRNRILRAGLNNTFAANAETRFDYNQIQGVRNNRFVTAEFLNGVENMAQRLGTRPEYILAVMSFETGGTFNPGVRNGIGATGLIQFLPSTARGLRTSTEALGRMSSTEQLRFVEKYFDQPNFRGRLGTLEGLYTAVLSGRARQNSEEVLFTCGTRAYEQNPLAWNNDGRITAGEAVTPVAARMYGGVRAIQQKLVDLGFVPENQRRNFADGAWGRNTAAALQRFQEANDLPATGLLDDRTGRALFWLRQSATTNGRHFTVNQGILMTDSLRPQLQTLADRYHQRTGNNLHVTSGYRPPSRQASAMYDLIQRHGTGYVRDLYANKTAVDQILSAYLNNGGSRNEAVGAMTRTIGDQVAHGVYISDHLRSQALDISTSANFSVLRDIVRGMGGSILNEGDHFHIEL